MPLLDVDEGSDIYNELKLHCKPKDESFEERDDDDYKFVVRQWKIARDNLNAAKELEDKWRRHLLETADWKNSTGSGVKVQKIMRTGSIDYSRVDLLKGIDLEQYRKPDIITWRISDE